MAQVGDGPPTAPARAFGRARAGATPGPARAALARAGRRCRAPGLILGLGLLTAACLVLNVGMGAIDIHPRIVVGILADHLGLGGGGATVEQDAVVWQIRMPRAVLAMLVGAGLAAAGAALQGIFRNPLADPGLIGISAGASVGAAAVIVTGAAAAGALVLPLAAALGGMVAAATVYVLARHGGRTEVVTLLLTGLAVNAIGVAAVGYLTYAADEDQLQDIVFWTLGSLGGATWESVRVVLPVILVGVAGIPLFARALNLMALGEREAGHLGLATERVRVAVIALCALAAGGAVAVAGVIGFVGLIVPHLVRLVSGPDHRVVLPASALGGAALLLIADLGARTLAVPREMPLGVLTGLLGGPFFLWLLHRTRRDHGGWG
jgi:iron complex transport system permease protein